MNKKILLASNECDANLIVCIPRVIAYALVSAKHDYIVQTLFGRAPLVTAYLNDSVFCTEADSDVSEYETIISLDYPSVDARTNNGMFCHAKEVLACQQLHTIPKPRLCFDWLSTAASAHTSKSMIVIASECCCDAVDAGVVGLIKDGIINYTELPLYENPWYFTKSTITKSSLNSVKSFAAMASLCFFYVGPHCIHSQIVALMGIPTFIFQENLNDNRIRVSDTIRAFPAAELIQGERHGSNLISKAFKRWRVIDRSSG